MAQMICFALSTFAKYKSKSTMMQWAGGSWNVCRVHLPCKRFLHFEIFFFFLLEPSGEHLQCFKGVCPPHKGYLPCPLQRTTSPRATPTPAIANTICTLKWKTLINTKRHQWRMNLKTMTFFIIMSCFHQERFLSLR